MMTIQFVTIVVNTGGSVQSENCSG